jgi:hypothetical protein
VPVAWSICSNGWASLGNETQDQAISVCEGAVRKRCQR